MHGNEAIWIKRHIESIRPYVDEQSIFHFELKVSRKFQFRRSSFNEDHYSLLFSGPVPWWLLEVFSFIGVCYILLVKSRKYDIINVHIGYPLLVYYHLISRFIRKPVVLTEHWSAYHFNFGVRKPLSRIKRIFHNRFPLITVSQCLKNDIERFSGIRITAGAVIPNIVDSVFRRDDSIARSPDLFFMLGHWKQPKNPNIVIQAFARLIKENGKENCKLRIGGGGPQMEEMKALVDKLNIHNNITFLGALTPGVAAMEMNRCGAFLHCSEYETFSVVCAEAACCGTPVIASAVGGIPEFIDSTNGVLVLQNTADEWLTALKSLFDFDGKKNSTAAINRFSSEKVGRAYFNFIKGIETHK